MDDRTDLRRVVVVGGSLAGLRAAETLRTAGFDGDLTVVGAEPHRPYDRPPLSKKLLAGEWDADRIQLRQPEAFADLEVHWRLGVPARAVDLDARELALADGETLGFDGAILATGAVCRRLPGQERHGNAHVLRSLDDALALRAELAGGGRRVVVIGAGFIGLEAAATARTLGNDVTVLEAAAAPLVRALGPQLGGAITALHADAGVDVRLSVDVTAFDPGSLTVESGPPGQRVSESIAADVVVVGVGVSPAVEWLNGSGIECRDGIVCDEHLAVRHQVGSIVPGVFASGDAARWVNPLFREEMRVEHWTNAAEQGAHAANNLLAAARGEPLTPYAPVPFFWSDQFAHRIQFLGRAHPGDVVEVVAGSIEERRFLALYGRDGVVCAALGVNAPRWVMPMRGDLLARASFHDAVAGAVARVAGS